MIPNDNGKTPAQDDAAADFLIRVVVGGVIVMACILVALLVGVAR